MSLQILNAQTGRPFSNSFGGTCQLMTRPQTDQQGTQEGHHQAIWQIDSDEAIPAQAAIELGKLWGPEPLPPRGAPLDFRFADWRFLNRSVFAFDYFAFPLTPGEFFCDSWRVEVNFRQPIWGQDEVPETAHLPPWSRRPEVKFDFVTVEDVTSLGQEVTLVEDPNSNTNPPAQIVQLGDRERMKNTAGYPYPDIKLAKRSLVARILFNSLRPSESIDITERFENTTNADAFTVMGRRINRHHARFISCEQWDGGYYFGRKYYRLEQRVEFSKTPYYITRKSEGPFYLENTDGDKQRDTTADGRPIPGPYPLTETGELANELSEQWQQNFLVLREENYGSMQATRRAQR